MKPAFFVPPRKEQAFLQGGTFVFEGTKTLYAHYDESTAAHASLEEVIRLAYGSLAIASKAPSLN
jgi:hypothetical protein